jgi:hypothetical protein
MDHTENSFPIVEKACLLVSYLPMDVLVNNILISVYSALVNGFNIWIG